MRQKMEISERQARVGIVANPAFVALPVVAPRDTMARWPDLRSPRRMRRLGLAPKDLAGTGPSTHALDSFTDEVRKRGRTPALIAFVRRIVRWPGHRH